MNRLEVLARGLLKPMNPYGSVLLGLLTTLWGLWILSPFWEAFDQADVYGKAVEFAPEWAWGTWATVCGLIILLALWRSSSIWLSRASGFAVWHWLTVAVMLWWGDWHNAAGLTYTFIGFYTVFVFLNIRVNYVKQGIHKF